MKLNAEQRAALAVLAPKRRAFVLALVGEAAGNATVAARLAGYSEANARQEGSRLLTFADVEAAVELLRQADEDAKIASAAELQQLWTRIARGEETEERIAGEAGVVDVAVSAKDRLKASELLGKTRAMFVDRVSHEGNALEELRALLAEKRKRKGDDNGDDE